ncbi:NADH-ubiquinone oxidoreductase subunit NDUFA12 family protein [Candidatus Tisiphia endosymbiont of Oplodontha viridula]|uniref:NADH-ubiquinone oxidoreductase subunit NDUFA12 family protein n=1 Tax=Candidatus Tisiphia endosymbiont of Oplodontha viridula TaxID=3077925 RepID=UPI0035C8841C
MSFIDNFFIPIFSRRIGKDQFGNKYYESKKLDYLGQARRQVVYKGKVEASKVPPMWHAWLHYMINEVPINNGKFDWQQDYLPNITSTSLSHKRVKNTTTKTEYNRWQPLGKSK